MLIPSSSRVLAIEELHELIRAHLSLREIKACALVSHQWHSLWGAHIWTQFRHKEHHRKSPVLQRHGSRIRHLSCDYLDKDTVKSVTQFCQSVQSLYLHLNLNAFWAHYDVLEGMFITLRDRLTKVHIRFDASVISPMLLWSLSQLPHLTDLHLDPYHSQYFEGKYRPLEEYLSLLRICIGLQSLTVGGCFLDTARPFVHSGTKEAIPRWMKKILRPKGDRAPNTIFAALARRLPVSSAVQPGATLPLPLPSLGSSLVLRRLEIQSGSHSVQSLQHLLGLCPLLEEIVVTRVLGSFNLEGWRTLAKYCPQVRLIRLENNIMTTNCLPDLATVVADFPCLESLELIDFYFDKDPDLVALDAHLHALEKQQRGKTHPLRRLYFTGAMDQPVKMLLDALAFSSLSIEYLAVGKTSSPHRSHSSEQTAGSHMLNFNAPWSCLGTLTHLDISMVPFPDNMSLHQFFSQAERSSCLWSLGLAPSHLRALYLNSESDGTAGNNSNNANHTTRPVLRIILPTLHTVSIGPSVVDKELYKHHEFGALLEAMPSLKSVGLRPGVGEVGLSERLAREHPTITFFQHR